MRTYLSKKDLDTILFTQALRGLKLNKKPKIDTENI